MFSFFYSIIDSGIIKNEKSEFVYSLFTKKFVVSSVQHEQHGSWFTATQLDQRWRDSEL